MLLRLYILSALINSNGRKAVMFFPVIEARLLNALESAGHGAANAFGTVAVQSFTQEPSKAPTNLRHRNRRGPFFFPV